ncbi:hypothetical protein TEA_011969 [Camellia sinensis var. sinensis]|uniref:Protein SCAR n=1 Tax=Camellia sinensis var. sinensis TaxID=542762 RepID=A0A4S4CZD0_CAMSN|nr:hypothetical protein TEA_011969 [Camellia sinensis var. sinensis]
MNLCDSDVGNKSCILLGLSIREFLKLFLQHGLFSRNFTSVGTTWLWKLDQYALGIVWICFEYFCRYFRAFVAEVFHGIQEQVMSTSSRSHKMVVRVQRIEAALVPLEKVVLALKSHLHFAYRAGCNWHSHLQNEQNHFIYGDLPNCIMDSYEECSDPPRLQLLDKFDTGGPGSCLKRYSDPTYFRRASANSREANVEKVSKDRKACRSKSISKFLLRLSTFNATLKSDLTDQSNYFDARTRSGHIEHEPKESSFSSSRMHQTVDSAFVEYEADLDGQTKQEVERSSNFSDDRTQYGVHGVHDLDLQPSNLESQTATYNSSNKMTSFDKPNSFSLESYAYEESPQMTGESSNTGNSLGLDFCGKHSILNASNVESDVINLPYSVSAEPNPQASESVTKSKDDTVSLSSQSNSLNGDVGKPDKLVQSSKSIEQSSAKCCTSCHNRDGMPDKNTSWRFLPTDLDAKHEKYGDSDPSNSFNDNRGSSLSETSTVIPGTGQAALPGVKAISTEASQRDGENASQMFGLSSRILVNGFQRNVSLVHDEKSEPSSSRKTDVFEQKSQNRSVAY